MKKATLILKDLKFQLTRSRGAWHDEFKTISKRGISTHTLTWSVTYGFGSLTLNLHISTHTLTWSVTCWQGQDNPWAVHFNSHAHVERDRKNICGVWAGSKFQLTRSRGAWHRLLIFVFLHLLFQLTRSRGAWLKINYFVKNSFIISTHTLTWSVTTEFVIANPILGFQLTRSRGAWPGNEKTVHEFTRFQLTRSRGAWHWRKR